MNSNTYSSAFSREKHSTPRNFQKNTQQQYNFHNEQPNNAKVSNRQNINNHDSSSNDYSLLLNDVYGKNVNSNNDSSDFSSIFNAFFKNNSNCSESNDTNNSSFDMPDIETLLKFKKLFERFNSKTATKDPMVNLLYAMKPFMQDSKKSVIDQITKFLTISSALQDFNSFL